MNILVPGSGLIALGSSWLGLALAVWFALGAEVALLALLFAPAAIPLALMLVAAASCLAAWCIGQGLLYRRLQLLCDPDLPEELGCLHSFAGEALSRHDYRAARSALLAALAIDDTDVQTHVLWAQLLTFSASRERARRAWRYAARLDSEARYSRQIQEALDHLQAS